MIDRPCEGSGASTHRIPSWYRDTLACGHTMTVEVLVPVPPEFRKLHVVGSAAFCTHCEPIEGRGIAQSVVLDTHELRRGVCTMCGQPVPCDDDGHAIEHDRIDVERMIREGAFDER